MIICLTIDNEQNYPGLRKQMHLMRHREFIKKQGYKTGDYRDMEFDAYDNPASVYLLYRTNSGDIIGKNMAQLRDQETFAPVGWYLGIQSNGGGP